MKKTVLFILLLCSAAAFAQKRAGSYSFIPRVSLNLSNLSKMSVDVMDGKTVKSAIRPDFMVGAEEEYQFTDALGVSLGVYYSRQGCHYPSFTTAAPYNSSGSKYEGVDNHNIKIDYLNVPVTANLYLTDFFSLRLGLQCGFRLSGQWDCDMVEITVDDKGYKTYGKTDHNSANIDWALSKTVWSIPVALGFEYEKVLFDVRYNIPLTGFCKDSSNPAIGSFRLSDGSNRVFTFSVGYRF